MQRVLRAARAPGALALCQARMAPQGVCADGFVIKGGRGTEFVI